MEETNSKDSCSFFKSTKDANPVTISAKQVYELLVSQRFKENTEKHRYFLSQGFLKEAQSVKDISACVTFSVICEGGHAKKNMVTYTGGQMGDFDDISAGEIPALMELLAADPYVFIAHPTISGEGIHVFCRTDVTDVRFHKIAYIQVNEHFARLLGKEYDAQCKDCTRPAYLCYAPDAIYHPDAEVMHIDIPDEVKTAKNSVGRPRKIHHTSVEKAAPSVARILKKQGKEYVEGHYNEYVSSAFFLMNAYGVPPDDVLQWSADEFPDYDAGALESILRSVYLHADEHGSKGLPNKENSSFKYASIEELETYVATQASIRNNIILGRREILWEGKRKFRDFKDSDENTLWLRAAKAGLNSRQNLFRGILESEYVPDFDPFVEYFNSLPPWDGETDYISQVAGMVHTEQPEIFRACFCKWFVALIAGLLNPDVVNQTVLTLIGEQGIYKTTFFNHLLPLVLRRYFYTKINSGIITKDDKITLSEFALICFEEIDSMRPSELNQMKAMMTMLTTNERAAYGRNKNYRPHVASFCATGNNRFFLSDDTGNRRWLPFWVTAIDDPYTTEIPYEGLYAQALSLYRGGFKYWFDDKEVTELNAHNKYFEAPNIEEELICSYLRLPKQGEAGIFMSTADVMALIGCAIKYNLLKTKINNAMDKLGFERMRTNNCRGFRVVLLTPEERLGRTSAQSDDSDNQQLPF